MIRFPIIAASLCGFGVLLFAQTQNAPAPKPQPQPVQTKQDRSDPFEAVPSAPQPAIGPGIIEGVEFRGLRRSPQDKFLGVIFSKVGDVFREETLRFDVAALRNTDRFEDVRVSTAVGKKGGIVLRFIVVERRP